MAERQLPKLNVAGSIPVSRSIILPTQRIEIINIQPTKKNARGVNRGRPFISQPEISGWQ